MPAFNDYTPPGNTDFTPGEVIQSSAMDGNFDQVHAYLNTTFVDDAVTAVNALSGDRINVGTLPGDRIVPDSVTDLEIGPDAVGTSELKPDAVEEVNILNGAVTNDKVASGIDGAKIANASLPSTAFDPSISFPISVTAEVINFASDGAKSLLDKPNIEPVNIVVRSVGGGTTYTRSPGDSPTGPGDWYFKENDLLPDEIGHVSSANGGTIPFGASPVGDVEVDYIAAAGNPPPGSVSFSTLTVALQELLVPVGAISSFAGSTAPSGWLICDGGEYLRTSFPQLDTLIGTTYGGYTDGAGGVGTTHLRVPDLRGRVAVGLGANGDVNALNDSDGLAVGARTPKHLHTVLDHIHGINGDGPATNDALDQGEGSSHHTGFILNGTGRELLDNWFDGTGGKPSMNNSHFDPSGGGSTVNDGVKFVKLSHNHNQPSHNHGGSTVAGGGQNSSLATPGYLTINYIIKAG